MKAQMISALRQSVFVITIFFIEIAILRSYEWYLVGSKIEDTYPILTACLYDVCTSFSFIIFIAIPATFLLTRVPRVGYALLVGMCSLYIVISFGLIQYFSVTLAPLGADFFGYSWNDIQTTATSSGGFSVATVISLLFFVGSFITACYSPFKNRVIQKISYVTAIGLICLMLAVTAVGIRPASDVYENDLAYYTRVSKMDFFIQRARQHFSPFQDMKASSERYPFLRSIKTDDTLNEYFNFTDALPNIVFIVVEGLGRDFVGNDAPYTGFTPFLDSLTQKSLYWKNALSNAGRTFGALPSILGSLPYGKEGFMSYGNEMPAHHTLISLLKRYGYTSHFFYGGNPNFDNQDIFMEAQGVDFVLDETKFPATYKKVNDNNGFTWGYPDRDVFNYSLQMIKQKNTTPRLDVYLTLSTHEPFQVPEESFKDLFESRLKILPLNQQKNYIGYRNIFECLLYTDHALQEYFAQVADLPGYNNTIFVITGDHRLVPIPAANKLSRFHVPLMIFSPLLKKAETFENIVTHADIAPAMLNVLHAQFGITFPKEVSFISSTKLALQGFSSAIDLALIRNKNETLDYVEGTYLLSEGRLFQITHRMDLEPIVDPEKRSNLTEKLKTFVSKSLVACEQNQLIKEPSGQAKSIFTFTSQQENFLSSNRVDTSNADALLAKAQTFAYEKKYDESRLLSLYILNKSPNYHDARILLARTFAWNAEYDTARYFLKQVLTRSPNYEDALIAAIDVAYWSGQHNDALVLSQKSSQEHDTPEMKARLARSLMMIGRKPEAKEILLHLLQINPDHELSRTLLAQIEL